MSLLFISMGGLIRGETSDGSQWLVFMGHPANALLAGLMCCLPLIKDSRINLVKGLEAGGKIVLVVGCGGAFGFILRGSGLSQLLVDIPGLSQWGLFIPFAIAAFIKTAEGSATVALITASAMVAPMLEMLGLDSTYGQLLALFACGAGAMTVAHVNDSLFWVIAEFTGMDTLTALKSLTVATLCQGVAVFAAVMCASLVLLYLNPAIQAPAGQTQALIRSSRLRLCCCRANTGLFSGFSSTEPSYF